MHGIAHVQVCSGSAQLDSQICDPFILVQADHRPDLLAKAAELGGKQGLRVDGVKMVFLALDVRRQHQITGVLIIDHGSVLAPRDAGDAGQLDAGDRAQAVVIHHIGFSIVKGEDYHGPQCAIFADHVVEVCGAVVVFLCVIHVIVGTATGIGNGGHGAADVPGHVPIAQLAFLRIDHFEVKSFVANADDCVKQVADGGGRRGVGPLPGGRDGAAVFHGLEQVRVYLEHIAAVVDIKVLAL